MISDRQEKLLGFLVKEYIQSSEPVSSNLLKKATKLNISPATIRNDLQILTKEGFIKQPHTSAGRIPTEKAYQYFSQKMVISETEFIYREFERARQDIEKEMQVAEELMRSLEKLSLSFEVSHIREVRRLPRMFNIISISRVHQDRSIDMIKKIIKELNDL